MLRSVHVAIVLGGLTVSPALPDIVNVAVNGTVSGTGSVTVECGVGLINPPAGCVDVSMGLYLDTIPFNFSATNSGQLLFAASEGEAPGPDSSYPLLNANPYQTTSVGDAGPGTLEIDLGDDYSVSDGIVNYQLHENDSISATFDLTEASMVSLDLLSEFGGAAGSAELLDSVGNVLATLPSVGTSASLDLLEAGEYTLDFSMSGGAEGSYPQPGYDYGDFQSSLLVTTTPIPTPEPRWTPLAALLAVTLGGAIMSRRRRVSSALSTR